MTDLRVAIPEGFTSVDVAPTGSYRDLYEVLYRPHPGQTHFENAVGRYNAEGKNPAYRWKTVEGDNVGDYGRYVFAYRRQQDELKIVHLPPEPKSGSTPNDQAGYDRAVELLAKEHLDNMVAGRTGERPSGADFVATMFGVPAQQVTLDYIRVSQSLYEAAA